MPNPPMTNVLTIDVEDYFQVSAFAAHIPRSEWPVRECRVERNIDVILGMLDDHQTKATFFTLGWITERYPDVVRRIVSNGHEQISDVQEFWSAEKIIFDKENEWTSNIEENLIPFASDCMGNIFCFAGKDLISRKEDCNVYFYDHDFDKIENLSLNFDEWIEQFNKIND